MLKWILGFLKAPIQNLGNELKANRAENIAAIEATVGEGTVSINAAVTGFMTTEAQKVPELAIFVPIVEPPLIEELTALEASGTNTVPELYDAGVAFVLREATEV